MRDVTMRIRMENHPGVLARVAAMFHRRGINIGALWVAPTAEDERVSELALRTRGEASDLERLALAIENLVDVYAVHVEAVQEER